MANNTTTYSITRTQVQNLTGLRGISNEDAQILQSNQVGSVFNPTKDFVELSIFTLDDVRLQTVPNYKNYSILSGDTVNGQEGNSEISVDVEQDIKAYGYQNQDTKVLYNFLTYAFTDNTKQDKFYIESISSDRTELRLVTLNISPEELEQTVASLQQKLTSNTYYPDLHLYFSNNIFYNIVNIDIEDYRETKAVLVKAYQPLPNVIQNKAELFVVEKVSDSIAFEVNAKIPQVQQSVPTLRGANFNVEVDEQATEPTEYFNYDDLLSFPTNNTYRELNSLIKDKGVDIPIDFSSYSNFINFSSAEERLRNFKYKLQLIDSYQTQLDVIQDPGFTYSGTGTTKSEDSFKNLINGIIENFDLYEKHLYFENGETAWPKTNNTKPFSNASVVAPAAISWYTNALENATLYDSQNPDILINTIPNYLREDPNNRSYEVFIHMIGQHFDNIWIYTDAVSNKYNGDNRLNRGVSKDLVEDLLKNFGIKLYTSNKSAADLFKYFTLNSYDISNEVLSEPIIQQGTAVSQNDYQKEIYKRIYHNLPLLVKSKGTERGLRTLINCFGIPSDILKIRLYGGQSANDLPFFGGEQAFTGSIDKVRTSNTGSVQDTTVSYYTSIRKGTNEYTQDLHRVEVGFSPTDNIDSYIVSQSAVLFPTSTFNIDDYIGDPRQSINTTYPALQTYKEIIFEDVEKYDLKDFVRFIKFFDNVLFRMVKDFVPARAVTDTGIIIKPHLLERSKTTSPVMTWTQPEYSGSIDTAFITGSNAGAFKSIAAGSINGESNVRYGRTIQTPTGRSFKFVNEFDQSNPQIEKNFGEAKFDGELLNSSITVSDGELNRDNPFKQIQYPQIKYNIQFYRDIPPTACILNVPDGEYILTRSPQTVNLATDGVFTGINPNVYSFKVDDISTNTIHDFQGAQYETFEISTEHNNDPIDNSATEEDFCRKDRIARIVVCSINNPQGTLPPLIVKGQPYNLYNWFFQQVGINSFLEFYIEGQSIGTVTDGEADNNGGTDTPTNYIFDSIDNQAQSVTVSVSDGHDINCTTSVTIPYDACGLSELINQNGVYSTILPNDGTYYTEPYNILNTVPLTQFEFQIQVTYPDDTIPSSGDITSTGAWTTVTNPVPNDYGEIITAYPLAEPADVPDSTSSGPLSEDNFTRTVRFKAINSNECEYTGRFYTINRQTLVKRAVTFRYSPNTADEVFINNLCRYPDNVTKTVYVLVPATIAQVTPTQVISQGLTIYEDSSYTPGTPGALATEGTYAVETPFGNLDGFRRWSINSNNNTTNGVWDTANITQQYGNVNNGIGYCITQTNDTGTGGDIADIAIDPNINNTL